MKKLIKKNVSVKGKGVPANVTIDVNVYKDQAEAKASLTDEHFKLLNSAIVIRAQEIERRKYRPKSDKQLLNEALEKDPERVAKLLRELNLKQ